MVSMARKLRRVYPLDRFHIRANRKLRTGTGWVAFKAKSRYYHCPQCGRKTLVRKSDLDVWHPRPSVFPRDLEAEFSNLKSHKKSFDFYCKGCSLPVRLIFWEQERGMGGWWYPYIEEVQESIEEIASTGQENRLK